MCTKCISKSPFGHFSRWVRGGRGLQPAAAARHPITFAQRGEKWEVDYNTRATLCRWAPQKTICTRLHDASQSFPRATACGWKFLTHIDVENISHTRVCARKHTHTHVSQLPVCYCKWTTLCFSLSLSLTHPRVCGYEYISRRRATGRGRRSRATWHQRTILCCPRCPILGRMTTVPPNFSESVALK